MGKVLLCRNGHSLEQDILCYFRSLLMYGHFGLLLENGLGLKQDESKVTRNVTFSSEICDERVGEMGENRFWFWDFPSGFGMGL